MLPERCPNPDCDIILLSGYQHKPDCRYRHVPHKQDIMSRERHMYLEKHHNAKLTPEEVDAGYRFCCEWDGLLIHASHPEAECCMCLREWRYANRLEERPKVLEESNVINQQESASVEPPFNPSDLLG